MTTSRKQQITDTTKRAASYWLKAQIATGKTEKEITELYSLTETREAIMESAKRLMN